MGDVQNTANADHGMSAVRAEFEALPLQCRIDLNLLCNTSTSPDLRGDAKRRLVAALRSPRAPSAEQAELKAHWVPHHRRSVGLPDGFLLGHGAELDDCHYRWLAEEGVEYVVFSATLKSIWFLMCLVDGSEAFTSQHRSKQDAFDAAEKDASRPAQPATGGAA